jgi:hypothetical protein
MMQMVHRECALLQKRTETPAAAIAMASDAPAAASPKATVAGPGQVGEVTLTYRFQAGFTNAVRRPVYIADLL